MDYSDHGAVYDRTVQNKNSWASFLANHSLKNYLAQIDLRGKTVLVVVGIFTNQAELKQMLPPLATAMWMWLHHISAVRSTCWMRMSPLRNASSNPGLVGSIGGVSLDKVARLMSGMTGICAPLLTLAPTNWFWLAGRMSRFLP